MNEHESFSKTEHDDSPEGLPEIILEENKKVVDVDVRDNVIHFNDLPKIWQEHILKRKAEGKLMENKNIFSKDEILKATSDENSFTSSKDVDKIFERAKKEKIPFDDLPKSWQEFFSGPENIFTNVTIEDLRKRGADEDIITKIKMGVYRNRDEERKIAELKEEVTKKMAVEPKELEANVDKDEEQTVKKPSLWSRFKSLWS
jgi:hypothetical protein